MKETLHLNLGLTKVRHYLRSDLHLRYQRMMTAPQINICITIIVSIGRIPIFHGKFQSAASLFGATKARYS